jgi:RecB family exonuclease
MSGRTDVPAPAIVGPARGGTRILVDQAACPFRAFACHRLGAQALERPEPGLGAPERGKLLHEMMARLWSELKDQATLEAIEPVERERLAAVARAWLDVERDRAPFEVVKLEEPMTLCAGDLQIQGRIDRMDRILDGGGLAIIDYKTGANAVQSAWLGERPDDCQLPLYALAAGDADVRAVAFARLRVGELGFAGNARDPGLLPEVKTVDKQRTKVSAASWEALLAAWREETARLGTSFAAGEAGVDPKRMLVTCQRCDLQPLCRVHERIGTLADEDEEE